MTRYWGAELTREGLALPTEAGLDFGSTLVKLARVAP